MGAKALISIDGRTCLGRALALFERMPEIQRVVVVGPPEQVAGMRLVVDSEPSSKQIVVCAGGDTRQQSVRAGLALLRDCDHVLVHDAARPLASVALARRVLAGAVRTGACIPGLRPRDAVKRVEHGMLVESLDRNMLVLAQTPQGFRFEVLQRAHYEAADAGLVGDDDGQLVAAAGHPVQVVEGELSNLKLTLPEDLEAVRAIMRAQSGHVPA